MKHPARRLSAVLALAVLFLPLAVLIAFVRDIVWPDPQVLLAILARTTLQATLSAALAVGAGLVAATGLFWIARSRWSRLAFLCEWFALLPSFVPSLFILLAFFKFLPWMRGMSAIVIAHGLIYTGLVAVILLGAFEESLATMADLAWTENASEWLFFSRGAWSVLVRPMSSAFLSIFALCFTSFAIPLVLGGTQASTVEVLIYQKIWFSNSWGEAVALAWLQVLLFWILPFALSKYLRFDDSSVAFVRAHSVSRAPYLRWAPALALTFIPLIFIAGGLFDSLVSGAQALEPYVAMIPWAELIRGSCVVVLLASSLVFIGLMTIAYFDPRAFVHRLLTGYVAPSAALTGFSFLLIWRETGFATLVKIGFALALVSIPSFYRLSWSRTLQSLEQQRRIASTLGASPWRIFIEIVMPQVMRPACVLAGLVSIWAWGDFALSSILAEKPMTLALLGKSLMSSYRLEAATFVIWMVLIGGLISFALWTGVGRVLGAPSQTKI